MSDPIGFVGLGNMGGPMAVRLLDAGHALAVFDTREEALAALLTRGARRASSAAEVGSLAETVLVSLPTPDIVRTVALGPNGIAAGTRIRRLVDLSTTGPRMAAEIARELAKREIAFVDSPVSGGVAGARAGTLAVMTACARPEFERLRPLLAVFGKPFYVGERPGLGQMMKLVNNLLSGAALAITSEAMLLGAKAGIDPDTMIEVLNAGSGRNSATQDKFPRAILPRRFDAGFATRLMYKDLKLCLEEAEALGLTLWVASAVRQLWHATATEIGADRDFTTIMQYVERAAGAAGIEVRGRGAER
ncbi:MAG TPA: NAD(P)-dependent oxidoreductase [Steroidobacteraceae bacterium]|nr:NAD(P)-dependent oxidoreductase [Steroidobacteraceae bacterium]